MDPLNPQNYGPALNAQSPNQMIQQQSQAPREMYGDMIGPLADALQELDPEAGYVINTVGRGVKKRSGMEMLMEQASKGETVDSLKGQVEAAHAADKALRMAEQSLELEDEDFDSILQQLQSEVEGRPDMPIREDPEQPSRLEQIVTAGLSLAMPNQAFNIGNAPYVAAQQRRDEQYQINVQRYGDKMARRAEKMEMLEYRLKIAESRRKETAEEVRRLADDAMKRGEQRKATALSMRSQIYDAKTPEEIDDRIKVMRENGMVDYLPDRKTIDGLKTQLGASARAEGEKLKFQSEKEEKDRVAKVSDDFVSWVNSNYPSGVSLGPTEVKIINQERARWAKDHGIPVSALPQYFERTAPATQGMLNSERHYTEGEDVRRLSKEIKEVELQQKKANLEKTLNAEAPESNEKKAKRKRISSLDTKAETARLALDQHLNKSPDPNDPEAYARKTRELLIEEYTIVSKKRQMVGAKVPTIIEYFRERFPDDSGWFNVNPGPPPLKGEIGNLGKGTSQQGNPPKGAGLPKGVG